MSRRPISTSALRQVALVAALAIVVIGTMTTIRDSAPTAELDLIVEGAPDPRGPDEPFLTCQRTLPDRPPTTQTGGQAPQPVGLVRSSEVVACPDVFDPSGRGGPRVEYLGEVVGDVLVRSGGAWVLVNDDAYALEHGPLPAHRRTVGGNTGLTVWLPGEVVDPDSLTPGRPGRRGDVLLLRGRIHRADPSDGGGLTLRASTAEVVDTARAVSTPFHAWQALLGGVLAAGAVVLSVHERRVRARR